MDKLAVGTVLVAREYLYRALQMTLGAEPTAEALSAVLGDATSEALACFDGAQILGLREAADALERAREAYEADGDSYLERAERDYMRMLVGPNELAAPPWECVYLTGERVLFQEGTLKVRETYRAQNMLPTAYPHVSDDHIAIELDFLAKLSAKARTAFEAGDVPECRRLLSAQLDFLENHLTKWAGSYAADLSEEAPESLYACAGTLGAAFAEADVQAVGELLEALTEG